MEYQNCPVEWITTETEKIAKDKENNNARNAALLAGGTGALGIGAALEHRPRSKAFDMTKAVLYVGGDAAALAGSLSAAKNEAIRHIDNHFGRYKDAELARKHRNLGLKAAGLGLAAKRGALLLNKIPYPVSKKRLAAKLGLITGGAAAASAGAHGLMTEKKASDINIRFGGKDKDDPKSGWKRAGKALAGHIAFPIAGAATSLAGVGVHEAAGLLKNKNLRGLGRDVGNLVAVGGTLAGITAPFINDAYQAGKYIQEH